MSGRRDGAASIAHLIRYNLELRQRLYALIQQSPVFSSGRSLTWECRYCAGEAPTIGGPSLRHFPHDPGCAWRLAHALLHDAAAVPTPSADDEAPAGTSTAAAADA